MEENLQDEVRCLFREVVSPGWLDIVSLVARDLIIGGLGALSLQKMHY